MNGVKAAVTMLGGSHAPSFPNIKTAFMRLKASYQLKSLQDFSISDANTFTPKDSYVELAVMEKMLALIGPFNKAIRSMSR